MDIVLVRHVRATGNEKGAYCGRGSDSPLSEAGRLQLISLSEKMKAQAPQRVFSSPLQRAKVTAESFFDCPTLLEELCEIDFGDFEGLTLSQIEKCCPEEYERMFREGEHFVYPNGEGVHSFFKRVEEGLQKIFAAAEGCRSIAVVAHGGTIRAILSLLLAKDSSLYWNFRIDNGSLTRVRFSDGFSVIEKLNEM